MVITQSQLQQIIRLSRNEQMAHDIFLQKYFPSNVVSLVGYQKFMSTPENLEYEKAEKELLNYITHLDYEAVLDLEALMEYGRELSQRGGIDSLRHMVEDGLSERADLLDSQSYFSDVRNFFSSNYPSSEGIEMAAIYLSEKPLYEYLDFAMEALDI